MHNISGNGRGFDFVLITSAVNQDEHLACLCSLCTCIKCFVYVAYVKACFVTFQNKFILLKYLSLNFIMLILLCDY
jgi:hypothetical protein